MNKDWILTLSKKSLLECIRSLLKSLSQFWVYVNDGIDCSLKASGIVRLNDFSTSLNFIEYVNLLATVSNSLTRPFSIARSEEPGWDVNTL